MEDADGKMRIEKTVNNNKNKKHKFGYINCATKTFLNKTCITLFGQQEQKRTKFPQIKRKLEKTN